MGEVNIISEFPCKAFMCYKHAFERNGYFVDELELSDFILQLREYDKSDKSEQFDFHFRNFINPELENEYVSHRSFKRKRLKLRF